MKRIQPISKERLKKTADIISNNRFNCCRSFNELQEMVEFLTRNDDLTNKLIVEVEAELMKEAKEWAAVLGVKDAWLGTPTSGNKEDFLY